MEINPYFLENETYIRYAHKRWYYNSDIEYFCHIHKDERITNLYDEDDPIIYVLKISIHEDQSKDNIKYIHPDYWGYLSYEKKRFELIYSSFAAMQLALGYDYRLYEEKGKGNVYRLKVEEV